jgi:hypothetical protein
VSVRTGKIASIITPFGEHLNTCEEPGCGLPVKIAGDVTSEMKNGEGIVRLVQYNAQLGISRKTCLYFSARTRKQ